MLTTEINCRGVDDGLKLIAQRSLGVTITYYLLTQRIIG
jgi:hypothetical protein